MRHPSLINTKAILKFQIFYKNSKRDLLIHWILTYPLLKSSSTSVITFEGTWTWELSADESKISISNLSIKQSNKLNIK